MAINTQPQPSGTNFPVPKVIRKYCISNPKSIRMKNKKQASNLIIIDASGSMGDKVAEVKGSLKQLFRGIREDQDKYPNVTSSTIVVDFSGAGDFRVLANVSDAAELTDAMAEAYETRGMTALNDAIGRSFQLVPVSADQVIVNILTDGMENDSKEFDFQKTKALIEKKRELGWIISFMGTSEQSIEHAVKIGISISNTVKWDNTGEGLQSSYAMYDKGRSRVFDKLSKSEKPDTDHFFGEEDEA